MTKADSIEVNLTDLDNFTKSIFSSCTFVPINISISKAFQEVYGKAVTGSRAVVLQQIYQWQFQFNHDFSYKFDKYKRVEILHLQSGQTVYIQYFNVTGIFYREGKPTENISIGLPDDMMTMDTSVTPVALIDADTTKQELRFTPL